MPSIGRNLNGAAKIPFIREDLREGTSGPAGRTLDLGCFWIHAWLVNVGRQGPIACSASIRIVVDVIGRVVFTAVGVDPVVVVPVVSFESLARVGVISLLLVQYGVNHIVGMCLLGVPALLLLLIVQITAALLDG